VGWWAGHEFARVVDLQWHERVSAKEKECERVRKGGGGVGGKRKSGRARERESERAREPEFKVYVCEPSFGINSDELARYESFGGEEEVYSKQKAMREVVEVLAVS